MVLQHYHKINGALYTIVASDLDQCGSSDSRCSSRRLRGGGGTGKGDVPVLQC